MAYSVDLEYTINEDFSGLQTVTESGQPASMSLQGLQSYQTYYTRAVLKKDGVIEDESEIESFQTLPAGTITLTHYQTTRSGYAYDVTYTYTSTYAPSWATLAVNGSTFQGTFDSAQHAVSFLVTGLTPGTAYLDLVTMGDIYGEEASVQGSIITTVVNDIDITSVDTAFTSADVNLEYIVDGGFYVGYVEWWLGTKDPLTDQADGYEFFNNGAETVTISGLSEGTDYKFRASITLSDQTTTINSSVVAVTTPVNYANQYFTIVNVSESNNTIGMKASNQNYRRTIYYSTNGGSTWSSIQTTTTGVTFATLAPGEKLYLRHSGALGKSNATARMYNTITSTGDYEVQGNVSSLTNNTNYLNISTMPAYAFYNLFGEYSQTNLVSAHKLSFASYTNASDHGCIGMFSHSKITTPPELPMTTLSTSCYAGMFSNCTELTTPPELPMTTLSTSCYQGMFQGCTSLTTPPELPMTTLSTSCYQGMFQGCTSLTTAPELPATTLQAACYKYMFYGCTALETAPELPARATAQECYTWMFCGCTSLQTPPDLPATTLSIGCYEGMFSGCTSMETAPELPATTLLARSYTSMFNDCRSLTEAPNLKHVTSIKGGYDGTTSLESMRYMYQNCSNLSVAYAPSIARWYIPNEGYGTSSWLGGVAESGVLYKPSDLEIPTDVTYGVPEGWTTEDY